MRRSWRSFCRKRGFCRSKRRFYPGLLFSDDLLKRKGI
nr:MAG TPA: hypothetical protein [Caudoviricetes sp.]